MLIGDLVIGKKIVIEYVKSLVVIELLLFVVRLVVLGIVFIVLWWENMVWE